MTATYRIAEVAERSGFSPATLRYYEEIGLLAPGRTAAGYRMYDDGSIERLRFIARAKQLGCTLDEVAELASAWDGGQCRHVQARLRAAAEAKVADAHARIAELTTLAADLRRALVALARSTPDGPCDDTCGCYGDVPEVGEDGAVASVAVPVPPRVPVPPGVPVPLVAKPAATDAPAIACSLDAADMGARLGDWVAVLGTATERLAIEGGVRVVFGPGTDAVEIARLASAEQACCAFFSFALTIDGGGVALDVRAPDEAADVVIALFGAPAR